MQKILIKGLCLEYRRNSTSPVDLLIQESNISLECATIYLVSLLSFLWQLFFSAIQTESKELIHILIFDYEECFQY